MLFKATYIQTYIHTHRPHFAQGTSRPRAGKNQEQTDIPDRAWDTRAIVWIGELYLPLLVWQALQSQQGAHMHIQEESQPMMTIRMFCSCRKSSMTAATSATSSSSIGQYQPRVCSCSRLRCGWLLTHIERARSVRQLFVGILGSRKPIAQCRSTRHPTKQ